MKMSEQHCMATRTTRGAPTALRAPTVTTMAGAPHDHKDEQGGMATRATGDGHDDDQGAPHDHEDKRVHL